MRVHIFRTVQLAVLTVLLCVNTSQAQVPAPCGFDRTIKAITAGYPALADTIETVRTNSKRLPSYKTSANFDTVVIPVVFHVILNQGQINALGDTSGIRQRINSQIEALNRDFNAQNEDRVKIPGGFKGLMGNAAIRFALAHTAPNGTATPGYNIVTTTKNGFNIEYEAGSGFGFSGAKHVEGGGVDAWDTKSYLNVWVVNTLENNQAGNVLGLAIPAYLAVPAYGLGPDEVGIIIHYGTLGVRRGLLETFVKGSDQGRTLVHEAGHFFELLHIWGDDEGKCPHNGGADDGIADTPPQSYASSACHTYPKYDGCTKTGDGIMFMNFMDYSSDTCLLLFTHGQVAVMRSTLQPGFRAYALTQQPWLTQYPNPLNPPVTNDFVIYPNPANNVLNIVFRKQAEGLKSVQMVDMLGRVVSVAEYDSQSSFYFFNVANLYTGIYFVILEFDNNREVRRVMVR